MVLFPQKYQLVFLLQNLLSRALGELLGASKPSSINTIVANYNHYQENYSVVSTWVCTNVRINWTLYPDLCILLHVSYTSVEPMKYLIRPAIIGRKRFIWLLICTSSFDFKRWNKSSQFVRVLCKSEAKGSLMLNHKLDWKPVGQESYLDCPALFPQGANTFPDTHIRTYKAYKNKSVKDNFWHTKFSDMLYSEELIYDYFVIWFLSDFFIFHLILSDFYFCLYTYISVFILPSCCFFFVSEYIFVCVIRFKFYFQSPAYIYNLGEKLISHFSVFRLKVTTFYLQISQHIFLIYILLNVTLSNLLLFSLANILHCICSSLETWLPNSPLKSLDWVS